MCLFQLIAQILFKIFNLKMLAEYFPDPKTKIVLEILKLLIKNF